jgi:hypothetical protein
MLSKKGTIRIQGIRIPGRKAKRGTGIDIGNSEKEKIPLKFLENILLEMRKAGFPRK